MATPSRQPNRLLNPPIQKDEACLCGRPSWAVVADLALQLWRLRETAFSDEVELLAARLSNFHELLGGGDRDMGYHRAIAREVLAAVASVNGEPQP